MTSKVASLTLLGYFACQKSTSIKQLAIKQSLKRIFSRLAASSKQATFGPSSSHFESAITLASQLIRSRQALSEQTLLTTVNWIESILREVASPSLAIQLETVDCLVDEILSMVTRSDHKRTFSLMENLLSKKGQINGPSLSLLVLRMSEEA